MAAAGVNSDLNATKVKGTGQGQQLPLIGADNERGRAASWGSTASTAAAAGGPAQEQVCSRVECLIALFFTRMVVIGREFHPPFAKGGL